MRSWWVMIGVVVSGSMAVNTIGGASVQAFVYAPIDRPGPSLSVPAAMLAKSMSCHGDLTGDNHVPVLLVPGTWETPDEHYGWNYMPAFDSLNWPYCAVTTPKHAMEDMQISAEYVVYAIRTMSQRTGRRIAILGGSQGGSLPRWALRFWPDTRTMVEDHIGLSPTNHGGQGLVTLCTPNCAPALWQQLYQSNFVRAMNSGQETFPGISYTEIYTHQDQFATPSSNDSGTSSLHGGGGRILNVALQDVCPGHFADHFKTVTYDAVGYALAVDALTHDGPANRARIDRAVCSEEFHPGVDQETFPTTYLKAGMVVMTQQATAERADKEPDLRTYVMER
jgi:triacylglycerol esterase/lipase EstA (alpha/beta hydrolase family)